MEVGTRVCALYNSGYTGTVVGPSTTDSVLVLWDGANESTPYTTANLTPLEDPCKFCAGSGCWECSGLTVEDFA
jgi:hypothetical protein